MSDKQDKRRLRRVADFIYEDLQARDEASVINWSANFWCTTTITDGWAVRLGGLGRNRPFLEVWLDRWPRRPQRYFWYAFYSPQKSAIQQLMRRLPEHLQPVRELSVKDKEKTGPQTWLLTEPLARKFFTRPIYEHYYGSQFFFGMYDASPSQRGLVERLVANRASAFCLDVLRELPKAPKKTEASGVYESVENRKLVVRHVQRERDGFLAAERKARDKYRCQVCGMRFLDVYGALGEGFAEAHHVVPLSKLKGMVRTTIDDLITVCANCHRVLHKMDGKRDDISKLRRIVRQRRR